MKSSRLIAAFLLIVTWSGLLLSQQPATAPSGVVPHLVNFSGKAVDAQGKTISGIAGVTFAIYKDQYEGGPLWMETQNVTADGKGNYTAQLGAATSSGLPLDLFSTGEARWLGVRINGGQEQPRVLLLSVPYALKAADAQTLGGLPAAAFVLAAPGNASSGAQAPAASTSPVGGVQQTLAGTGTVDYVPLWTPDSSTLGDSVLFQSGSGSTAKLGINTTTPAATLDVKGGATVRGTLSLTASGTATASGGKNSQSLSLAASAFNSTSSTAVNQIFQWQAQAAGNDTAAPSGILSLLFGEGATKPSATGLNIASNGQITFATGQNFPGTGALSSVALTAPSSDFTVSGSPLTTNGTLGLNWTVAPTNAATPNAIVKRDSNGSFNVAAVVATLGVSGNSTSNSTAGVEGQDSLGGYGVLGVAKGTSGQGVWGESYGTSFGTNAQGSDGVHGQAHSVNGSGVAGLNSDPNGKGVYAWGMGTSSTGAFGSGGAYGVYGTSSSSTGTGVYGTGSANGVYGASSSTTGTGVYGSGLAGVFGYNNTSSAGYGVQGTSTNGVGVYGSGPTGVGGFDSSGSGTGVSGTSSGGNGVFGISTNGNGVNGGSTNGTGVFGNGAYAGVRGTGNRFGVLGVGSTAAGGEGAEGDGYTGVAGVGTNTGVYGQGATYGVYGYGTTYGVYGQGPTGVYGVSTGGNGVYATSAHTSSGGWAVNAYGTSGATGVLAGSDTGYAAWFNGNVEVDGNLVKSSGSFKIDHPLDPANKYLYHSFVESPDMMNIYNGNVTTDAQGYVVVELPEWFETLNRDFRYQLTVIGQFAQAIVFSEIAGGRFSIKTDKPNVKVSWQVTGIRQDAWANAHRIPIEEAKPELERGSYLHPELYGAPEEKGILWATAPKAMKQWKEARAKPAAHEEATTAKP